MASQDPFGKLSYFDSSICGEAADWLVKFQSGETSEEERLDFERWRNRSASHAAAWERAETLLNTFTQIPPGVGRGTLEQLSRPDRRRVLKKLGLLVVAIPSTWLTWNLLPWQEWTADFQTSTGEQKTIDLVDGTRLVLNTASAVDVTFDKAERRLTLHAGEILVTTGHDPSYSHLPLIVETTHGMVYALGTQFSARRLEERTRVIVFQDAVEIRPAEGPATTLHAGHQADFGADGTKSFRPADAASALWAQGMLAARNITLCDLLHELERYRRGILHCHPNVANMRVSGVFPVKDIDASLALLEKTMPLRIRRFNQYWILVEQF